MRHLVILLTIIFTTLAADAQNLSVECRHIGSSFKNCYGNSNTSYNGIQISVGETLFSKTDLKTFEHKSLSLRITGNYGRMEEAYITPGTRMGNMGALGTTIVYVQSLHAGWTLINMTNGGWNFATSSHGASNFVLSNATLFIRRVNRNFSWGLGLMTNSNDCFVPLLLPFVSADYKLGDINFEVKMPRVTFSKNIIKGLDLKLHIIDMDIINSTIRLEGRKRLFSHFGLNTTLQPEFTVGKFKLFSRIGYNWYKNITLRKRIAAGIYRKKHKVYLDESSNDIIFSIGICYGIPLM